MTFLEQLQESAGLLNNKIKDTDTTQIKSLFGNYNPNLASDYVATPFGQPIAQNRFLGNQFQMPNLSGQTYTPGAMAPGSRFNFGNFGTYSPQPFNQYGNMLNNMSNVATTTTQPNIFSSQEGRNGRGGANAPRDQRGYESIGGMNLSINPATGRIEILEDGTLQSNLLTDIGVLQKYTPTGLLSSALGGLTNSTEYGRQLDRIESQFGKPVADEIAATVRESYGIGKAQPTGVLSAGLKPGTEVTSNGVKGFINSQGNFQRGTLIGKLDADLPGGVNYEANKRAEATQKAVDAARARAIAEQATQKAVLAANKGGGGGNQGNQGGYRDVAGVSKGRNIHG